MDMYFVFGNHVTILFKQWTTRTTGELVASCFALFVMGVLYEGLKVIRQILAHRAEKTYADMYMNASEGRGLTSESVVTIIPPRRRMKSLSHIVQTLLHMVQVLLGYLLMLAFMTYNVWVGVAVVVGSGVGFFLFGWKSTNTATSGEHCN